MRGAVNGEVAIAVTLVVTDFSADPCRENLGAAAW
jgi:hypothetical protein